MLPELRFTHRVIAISREWKDSKDAEGHSELLVISFLCYIYFLFVFAFFFLV